MYVNSLLSYIKRLLFLLTENQFLVLNICDYQPLFSNNMAAATGISCDINERIESVNIIGEFASYIVVFVIDICKSEIFIEIFISYNHDYFISFIYS